MQREAGPSRPYWFVFLAGIVMALVSMDVAAADGASQKAGDSPKVDEKQPDGKEIFRLCGQKDPGHDQRSRFIVMLMDGSGKVKRSEYIRFWKDFGGKDGVSDKMMLFNILPNEARGAAFLRVAHVGDQAGQVDQFIYLPALRKIRRVSIRDPGDSFLNSNLTYADVGKRALEEDEHRLIGIRDVKGVEFYVVESIPKESKPLYGKRVSWFLKTPNPDDCVTTRIDYFDQKGDLIKDQFIQWQHIDGAWIWDRVLVRSRENMTQSVFQITDAKVNLGLDDDIFSVRTLNNGLESIPGELAAEAADKAKKVEKPKKAENPAK